jgi:phosphoribosylformylglycinamidine cyclo-ligase
MKKEFTYAKAGVDISKIKKAHKSIAELLKETFSSRDGKFGKVLTEIGHYAGLINIGGNRVLALHVDGVGTKVLLAQTLDKYDTVGIDCVAMCVNDVICMGAEPVALVDYLVVEEPNDEMINEITMGLVEGAKQADVAIVGGETAVMKDVITGVKGKGFDLAAMCVGVVDKDKIITGEKIKVGDLVIGLESSGIHSNGLTLARKVLSSDYEELLKPTLIYVKPVLEIIDNCEVHGLANITGGAFSKLMRIGEKAGVGFLLDDMPELPEIFKSIQKQGNISDREMYRTFNCGIGFCVVVPESESEKVVDICKKHGINSRKIGKAVKEKDVKIKTSTGVISILTSAKSFSTV